MSSPNAGQAMANLIRLSRELKVLMEKPTLDLLEMYYNSGEVEILEEAVKTVTNLRVRSQRGGA